jgi:glycosyltransferase involved in cell wall biosynthesis
MKIVYISESIIPSQTANSIHVMKMCQALALNGNDVILLIPNKIKKNTITAEDVYNFYGVEKCFKIISLPFSRNKLSLFIFSLASVIKAKKEQPHLIYTRFLYACFFSLLMRISTVFEIHSSFTTKIDKFCFLLINKNKLKKIVAISKALRNYLLKKYKINSGNIIVAPDGADPVPVSLKSIEIKNNNKLIIGYVGHLYKGKGMELITKMAEKCPWAEFHVIGGLPEDLDYWKKELIQQKNIIFYGHVSHKEVYRYMLSFDALIAPYQRKVCVYGGGDGDISKWMSPLKIFEYMAAGKAILASDLPVLREILVHGKNSLLADPDNIDKWISNLELIRNDLLLRKELGEGARREFEKKYTWKSRASFIISSLNV